MEEFQIKEGVKITLDKHYSSGCRDGWRKSQCSSSLI